MGKKCFDGLGVSKREHFPDSALEALRKMQEDRGQVELKLAGDLGVPFKNRMERVIGEGTGE